MTLFFIYSQIRHLGIAKFNGIQGKIEERSKLYVIIQWRVPEILTKKFTNSAIPIQ